MRRRAKWCAATRRRMRPTVTRRGQALPQRRPGPVQHRPDRRHRDAHGRGHAFGGQPEAVLEQHRRPVPVRQAWPAPPPPGGGSPPPPRRPRGPARPQAPGTARLGRLPPPPATHPGTRGPYAAAASGTHWWRSGAARSAGSPPSGNLDMLRRLEQGAVGHVLGVLAVPAQLAGQPPHVLPVTPHRIGRNALLLHSHSVSLAGRPVSWPHRILPTCRSGQRCQ